MTAALKPIRVGILGYGFATATFHAPLVSCVLGLQLSAVASTQPAKVHADWPDVQVFDSPHALINSDAVDLVVVPTPNQTHHALAKAALALASIKAAQVSMAMVSATNSSVQAILDGIALSKMSIRTCAPWRRSQGAARKVDKYSVYSATSVAQGRLPRRKLRTSTSAQITATISATSPQATKAKAVSSLAQAASRRSIQIKAGGCDIGGNAQRVNIWRNLGPCSGLRLLMLSQMVALARLA